MTQTSKITFAAATLAALIAVPAFAAPAQPETSRIGQAWTIVNERHHVDGDASSSVGPVFQSEVDDLLRSGQPLNELSVKVAPKNTNRQLMNVPRLIEGGDSYGG